MDNCSMQLTYIFPVSVGVLYRQSKHLAASVGLKWSGRSAQSSIR